MTIVITSGCPDYLVASGHRKGAEGVSTPNLGYPSALRLYCNGSMGVYSCLGLHYFIHLHSTRRNRVVETRNAFAVEVAGMERKAGRGTWIPTPALPSTASSASLPFFQFCGYLKIFPAPGPLHMLFSHVQRLLSIPFYLSSILIPQAPVQISFSATPL